MRLRWLLVALSALLAVALIANGNILAGVIIGVLAVVRVVMIMRWQLYGQPFDKRHE